jgi:polyisoprenoid-binding protein YceI
MISKTLSSLALSALLLSPAFASGSHDDHAHHHAQQTDVYQVDAAHSKIGFKVAHLGITSVAGSFKKFSGEVHLKGDNVVAAQATIDVPTVFTDNEKRDNHLKAEDFFSSETFPMIKFKSTSVVQNGKELVMHGQLTIRDVTKKVMLKGEFGGKVYVDMWKVHKTGLSLTGTINRQDFGLRFNKFLGTGEAMVGDEVTLQIDIQANKPG